MSQADHARLEGLLREHPNWVVLTGAGLSAASGIPTYRDDEGEWKRADPIQHQDFIDDPAKRQRYWARSVLGWQFIGASEPGPAHRALVRLEAAGHVDLLVTQNVDRLHQRAGHANVVDLHGRLDRVICLSCKTSSSRTGLQAELESLNPQFREANAESRPDGDAEAPEALVDNFRYPDCHYCAGVLMPDVVFFGGTVPRERVEGINRSIQRADALVVAGSSLMVYSGYRFCRLANELGKPIIIINRGRTRADDLATLKVTNDCHDSLSELANRLGSGGQTVVRAGQVAT